MEFVKAFNAATADKKGLVIPVIITIYSDRSFDFVLKTPPASVLIKKAAGIEKGAHMPKREWVGQITKEQLRQIAETKMPDLNCYDIETAMKIIKGTAENMGVKVVD
jgi:large subunit ribosomal protein L11